MVLAVCAGFQIVGRTFPGAAGEPHEGVGLLDVETVKSTGPRAVGEVLVEVDPDPSDRSRRSPGSRTTAGRRRCRKEPLR